MPTGMISGLPTRPEALTKNKTGSDKSGDRP
jgi:hypothetical protein